MKERKCRFIFAAVLILLYFECKVLVKICIYENKPMELLI